MAKKHASGPSEEFIAYLESQIEAALTAAEASTGAKLSRDCALRWQQPERPRITQRLAEELAAVLWMTEARTLGQRVLGTAHLWVEDLEPSGKVLLLATLHQTYPDNGLPWPQEKPILTGNVGSRLSERLRPGGVRARRGAQAPDLNRYDPRPASLGGKGAAGGCRPTGKREGKKT